MSIINMPVCVWDRINGTAMQSQRYRDTLIALLTHRTFQVFFTSLTVGLLLFLTLRYYFKIIKGNDFETYFLAAQCLLKGQSPYFRIESFPYLYPLFFAWVLIPLTALPLLAASMCWYLLNIFFSAYGIYLLIKMLDAKNQFSLPLQWAAGCGVFWILLPAIQNDLFNGQVNLLVLLLCILFYYFYQTGRVGRAILCLSLGIAIKIYPAIYLLYFFVRKEWKPFLFSLFLTAVFCLLPILTLGVDIFRMYWDYVFKLPTTFLQDALASRLDVTLYGFFASFFPFIEHSLALMAITSIALLIVLAVYDRLNPNAPFAFFSLYLIAILFLQPMSETHHLVLLTPTITFLLTKLLDRSTAHFSMYAVPLFLFMLFYYIAGYDKDGPYYFLAILVLVGFWLFYLRRHDSFTIKEGTESSTMPLS
ncbi:DUF2029 domain-containing protein [bacterium]|nr:DUF2029 domain-containing protein [bacterium]